MKIKVNEKLLGGGLCTCMFPFSIDKSKEEKKDSKKEEKNEKDEGCNK